MAEVPPLPPAVPVDDGMTYEERLREAASWNLVLSKLEIAAEQHRRAGHPATRRGT